MAEAYRTVFFPLNRILEDQQASQRWAVQPSASKMTASDAPAAQHSGTDVADPANSRPAKRQCVVRPDAALLMHDQQYRAFIQLDSVSPQNVYITVEAKQVAVLGDVVDLSTAWNSGNSAVQAVLAQAFGQMVQFETSLGVFLTLRHVWLLQRPEGQPGTLQVRFCPVIRPSPEPCRVQLGGIGSAPWHLLLEHPMIVLGSDVCISHYTAELAQDMHLRELCVLPLCTGL